MATKSELKTELAINQTMVHRDWLELNKYLMENTDDTVIQDRCKRLSAGFRACGALDTQVNPGAVRLAPTSQMLALEQELAASGWK